SRACARVSRCACSRWTCRSRALGPPRRAWVHEGVRATDARRPSRAKGASPQSCVASVRLHSDPIEAQVRPMNDTYRATMLTRKGDPDVLENVELPLPEP